MFSNEPFSTLPMSDDGSTPRSLVPPVIYFNNRTLTFPLKINRVASFTLERINLTLEFSLNRNTVLDFAVRR